MDCGPTSQETNRFAAAGERHTKTRVRRYLAVAHHGSRADEALAWQELSHLPTREVGEVLEPVVRRMVRYLERRGALEPDDAHDSDDTHYADSGRLESSAVSGQVPPAGPQWLRGLRALEPRPWLRQAPCASLDGFTLQRRHARRRVRHSWTRGPASLRARPSRRPRTQRARTGGLVAVTLKRAYADGAVAVVVDPLSLLCRLAMSVPPSRYHTVKYAGVLASANPLSLSIAPVPARQDAPVEAGDTPYCGAEAPTGRGPSS